ncbi:hypothetical protein XU06_30335 (plasmid) [Rhodococcus erythropolis]|uniref:class I adenylate-forming enzyme family protein n=1 Tax=Rhodococcus erythropolis TaxID=1833 RepID=UPI00061B7318|nr:class I adenylate-forming enzyme family protein [Rhodococcus erythropolis]AKE01226.1 hypothetical protein XU06_30335 [Rhodococcus erythropolis]
MTVGAAFERVARLYPDHEAAVDSGTRLTFADLDDASRRCVTLLRELGVTPGDRVALLTLPSTVHLVAWLSVVRLGAIPVVLHTRETAQLQVRLCEKFEVDTVLYDRSLANVAHSMTEQCARPLSMVALRSAAPPGTASDGGPELPRDLAAHDPAAYLHQPAEDDPAVIILSSGTTSLPKGLVHSHRNLIDASRTALALYAGLRPGQRVIVPYSTAFTASYATILPFLNAGACTVFLEKFDLANYQSTIRAERITHVSLTPTMWRKLLNLPAAPDTYDSVTVAQFAAEPMDSTTLQKIRETVATTVVQAYGSTETLAFVTVNVTADMDGDRLVSVGRPFVNTEVRIIRRGGTVDDILPTGSLGEVAVNSPHVAQQVWGDDKVTASLLHTAEDGRRWWRSGDLGRLDEGGFLFLEGRSDDMIISGGINIMPTAIEEVLLSHPSVVEAAVVGLPHPDWGEQVHAFVVTNDPNLTGADFENFAVSSALSGYQRPREYHIVDSLPRTATNKLSRRVLRESALPPR